MEQLYAGTYGEPPSTSPPGVKGKSVWWISCSQAVVSCSAPAAAAKEAAQTLGIDFHIADGKFNQALQPATPGVMDNCQFIANANQAESLPPIDGILLDELTGTIAFAGQCATAGHATAPPANAKNSRRFMPPSETPIDSGE